MSPQPSIFLRVLSASVLGICLLASECVAGNPRAGKIDALFARWDRPGSPGMAVVVVKDGAVVYQHGYGYANLEHHIPITPQTAFDVASVAKQFTGLFVAMLVQQGKLSLEDDIHKYLPDMPDFGKPITIDQLLHHTSGLRDWPETLRLSGLNWEGPIGMETILDMVRRQRELDFAPGEEHQYSNTGYNLLAAAVAKITGMSFRAWTDANLFQPLNMKHTQVCDNSAEIIPDSAFSYTREKGKFRRVYSQLAAPGSSSLFISAEDMGKWLLNFDSARVGGKAAIELMRQPGKLNGGRKVNYGFGLTLFNYHQSPAVHHGGSWAAYRSFVMWIPEKRFAVAVLANTDHLDTSELASKVTDLYLDTPSKPTEPAAPKPVVAARVDRSAWDAYPGTYRLGRHWLLTVTREGDQLMVQASHEAKFPTSPLSATKFMVEAYNAPIEFVRQDSGTVTNLLYRGIRAPKLTPPIHPELNVTALAEYTGDYWSEELQVVDRLEVHDGKLAQRQRSGRWIHFTPVEAGYFETDEGWNIEFIRNAASEVVELRESGGRVRGLRYTRVNLSKPNPPVATGSKKVAELDKGIRR